MSGIKDFYKRKDLIGKQIIVVTNLEPAIIRGIKSEGMLLAAENKKGDIVLLEPDKGIEEGSVVL